MKKIFSLSLMAVLAFSTIGANAASSFKTTLKDVKSAAKADAQATRTNLKNAVKADITNAKNEASSTAAAKKAEKIAQIDKKINDLNTRIAAIKKQKDITETQKALQIAPLQKQVDYYTKQKAALK